MLVKISNKFFKYFLDFLVIFHPSRSLLNFKYVGPGQLPTWKHDYCIGVALYVGPGQLILILFTCTSDNMHRDN